MSLYRVTGTVTAPDGTSYGPVYWGRFWSACSVFRAIADGAVERREAAVVRLDKGDGTPRIAWVRVPGVVDPDGSGFSSDLVQTSAEHDRDRAAFVVAS